MFYISSITGALVPFDPKGTSDTQVQTLEPSSSVQFSTTLSSEISELEVQKPNSNIVRQDAAVFDGHSTSLTGAGNAVNIGRTGAAIAYGIKPGNKAADKLQEGVAKVGSIEESKNLGDVTENDPHRVHAVSRSGYKKSQVLKEKKQAVFASDIMSTPVFSLQCDEPLQRAQKIFKDKHFRHIPIVSGVGNIVGILSDRDILGIDPWSMSSDILIKDRMVTNILTARPQTEIKEIAKVMIQHRIGCLPIVDDKAVLVGMLTRSDILRAIVNHAPIEMWT